MRNELNLIVLICITSFIKIAIEREKGQKGYLQRCLNIYLFFVQLSKGQRAHLIHFHLNSEQIHRKEEEEKIVLKKITTQKQNMGTKLTVSMHHAAVSCYPNRKYV